jgi:hypothetical protein
MPPRALFIVPILTAAMCTLAPSPARAVDPKIELGASLAGFMIHTIV